ncbi:probable calcium-binding protein CML21 isoform X3 [Papaver somniferum]|uniref:probable calcium-binding protein CML21 isoform X3 n=1 Tax=Papaver somniferum TaxID=3469 RepID=UPI000E7053E0|nr:probable calcium-binding protein CML21 isoform X3 [Papaver somniferum]
MLQFTVIHGLTWYRCSSCCLCSSLKSFFSDKVQGMLCRCNTSSKYKRLNPKLEKKMVEAIKKRGSSEPNTFKSINSIILRFPKFKEGLKNIKSVFDQYDEDSNGTIDHEELKHCLNKLQLHLTEREIEDLFQACDVDGIEGIQLNEFVVLLCLIYLLMDSSENSHSISRMGSPELEATFDTIVEAFMFLDKNGDGKLNKEEMVMALNEASPWEKSPGRISRNRFKEMDWSNSGKVSFKEFLFALTNWVGIDADDEKEHVL